MDAADESRAEALAGGNPAVLAQVFREPALHELRVRADTLARRGLRMEEESAVRSLVFFDPERSEGIVQVVASDRLVTPEEADPAWAATARQVWSRMQFAGGRWWVVEEKDLSPDQWRPTP